MAISKNVCSVLIPSCDAYRDMWTPFFTLFRRHWPDCPFPVFLGANNREFTDSHITVLHSGDEINWTSCVIEYLSKVETPYVLLCLEDFFFRRRVDTAEVCWCLDALADLEGHCLRLVRRPGPDQRISGWTRIGLISRGAPYRVSTQATIWKRSSLLSLLRDKESIWEFEINGSERAKSEPDGFYCVTRNVLHYGHHVVHRGKWYPWEAQRFSRAGVGCDFSARQAMGPAEVANYFYWKSRSLVLNTISWRWRLALKSWIARHDRIGVLGRAK